MSKKPETAICEKIIEAVRGMGGFAIHVPGSIKQANQPDLDGALWYMGYDGEGWLHFKIEVKQPGQFARPAQEAMLNVWSNYGYVTGVAHSVDEFFEIIRNYVEHKAEYDEHFRQTAQWWKPQ